MQERTRSQMLEDIVGNLQNHAETGQIPKPYRRGSWRPIGHMRPSSPLLDSVRDQFEGQDQMAKDFSKAFVRTKPEDNILFDVSFLVGQGKAKKKLMGIRAILGVRSRVFQEMLYGISTVFGSPQVTTRPGNAQQWSIHSVETFTTITVWVARSLLLACQFSNFTWTTY